MERCLSPSPMSLIPKALLMEVNENQFLKLPDFHMLPWHAHSHTNTHK